MSDGASVGVSVGLVMLYLSGATLGVNNFMGTVMFIGIVVSNGVLLTITAVGSRDGDIALRAAEAA